jgi:SAM-dependent methyltransferase
MTEIMSIWNWKTNADLIAAVATLGYLNGHVLDATFGLGNFWTKFRPQQFTACDLDPAKSPIGFPVDFRDLPFKGKSFDTSVLDGPYRLNGTPDMPFDDSFGTDVRMHWEQRIELIKDGIEECVRVTKNGGYILVKCQDQVCSGQIRWQADIFTRHAEYLRCRKVDRFDILSYRKQPPGRSQKHARRNSSTLLVFQK